MNTDLFNFNGQQLRHLMIDGEPWFMAVHVLKCIGLKTGTGAFYNRLDADEQRSSNRITLGLPAGKPMKLVNESGLYKLIMRSDKPEAIAFQNWVTKEVLPAIRRTGGYLLRTSLAVTSNQKAPITAHPWRRTIVPDLRRPSIDILGNPAFRRGRH
jgi:prophage antirepressor-like protein